MKKIINGKLYDTEKAHKVGEVWKNNKKVCEGLYRKKTGEYFLAGAGDASSIWGRVIDGKLQDGGDIFPLTLNDAKAWAEKNLTTEEHLAEWGEPKK